MSQSSSFVPIRFQVAGKLSLGAGCLGAILVGIAAFTGWFNMPTGLLIPCLALVLIGLYLLFVVPREGEDHG